MMIKFNPLPRKKMAALFLMLLSGCGLYAGVVEKTYYFSKYTLDIQGDYRKLVLDNSISFGLPGEPMVPWRKVVLLLPPGEVAVSMEIVREQEMHIPGRVVLFPAQYVQPLSKPDSGAFVKSEKMYGFNGQYPVSVTGRMMTQYLYGFSIAMASFTPACYNPALQKLSFFGKVTIRIHTRPDQQASDILKKFGAGVRDINTVKHTVENPGMAIRYPVMKTPVTNYQYLVVSPTVFKNEFQNLITLYATRGVTVRVVTVDSITSTTSGSNAPEKIRNFIIGQRINHLIDYVLLAGNPSLVPCRYLHCSVESGGTYYDSIPADLYYSALDGNFDANANKKYGELEDNCDLYPELSVGRFPVNDTSELRKMIRKTIAYQTNPVRGEFSKPLLAGEYLYNAPVTFGSDYMDLLIDDHTDNGYFTHGIPSATNQISTLYDSIISPPLNMWQWSAANLLTKINQGNSFIHHLGHANTTYMLRLSISSVTNANFSQVNGTTHNYQLLYTQGCYDGAFDAACIAAKAVKIDNWLVAGVFNSRYGWFNQGTTDGPSQHLEREFVSAVYNDTTAEKHIGTAHMISKIETAPWVSLPGEFEPGAQLWCHYCCNVFGDPALEIWTAEPSTFMEVSWTGAIDSDWSNPGNWSTGMVPGSVANVTIPATTHDPVINTQGIMNCNNLTIASGANLLINPGKSVVVYGSVTLAGE